MIRAVIAMAAMLLLSRTVPAAEPQDPAWPKTLDELKQRVERVVTDHRVPAIGVALVNRDGPVWVAGWGKADLKSGRAADQDTLFRIGSVSKMFAALAVLKLVEEGRLSLDDKVHDRAPDVAFENPWEATHPVRIAHLLEHTTGWDDGHLPEYASVAADTDTIKQGLDFHPDSRKSRWPPGARHAYNNIGPAVAAYIVERAAGQRFEDYVGREFLEPLGMASTSYFRTKSYEERGATLYRRWVPVPYWQMIHRPAGSMNSSARDMAKFLRFLATHGANQPLISEASFIRMETPGTLPGNAQGVLAGYGLYNYTTGYGAQGVAFHGHNGGVMGGLTELAYVPSLGEGYVFMINDDDAGAQSRISDLFKGYLLRNVPWPDRKPADLPEKYRQIDGWYQGISPRSDHMFLAGGFLNLFKVTHDDKFLHRSPLAGGWTSSDYVGPRDVLVDQWSGLPAIAVVDDPLVGPALQVGSDLYARVASWKVYARLVTPALMIIMTIAGTIACIAWAVRRRRKTTTDSRLWLRLWPLIASLTFSALLVSWLMAGLFFTSFSGISPQSVGLFVVSLVYPLAALAGAIHLFSTKARSKLDLSYWFAAAFVTVHLSIASYMAMVGAIGIRTWA